MEPDWDKIYLNLYAFTDQLLKSKKWFRGPDTDSYLLGKQTHDYVLDAIEKYLSEPGKFDPTLRSLQGYLKQHIIRRAISNDLKTPENRLTSDVFKNDSVDDDDHGFLEHILPYQEAFFGDEMDLEEVMDYLADQIKNDDLLFKIFRGHCRDFLKRREVIQEYSLSENDYDNGIRRLTTVLKACSKKFGIKAPKKIRKKEL